LVLQSGSLIADLADKAPTLNEQGGAHRSIVYDQEGEVGWLRNFYLFVHVDSFVCQCWENSGTSPS
jgi:hypothetical protein